MTKIIRHHSIALLLALGLLVPAQNGAAQAGCDAATLSEAADTYDVGRFASTIGLLRPCLPNGFTPKDQRVSAYRLMALSYVARDSLQEARRSVRMLLKADGRFKPDPQTDPRVFTDLVSDLKPRWYTWLWRGNAWYHWAGRTVVVGSVAALPFLLRNEEVPDLPAPPVYPEQ